MNSALLFRTVASRLWRFKAKTLFMGLGITLGVLVTVVLQSVATTVTNRFVAFIKHAYPANAVVLMSGGGPMSGGENRDRLRLDDIQTVIGALSIQEWDPMVLTRREVKRGAMSARIPINGHSERAESVRQFSVRDGEFLSAEDVSGRANVAVIGSTAARELFANESPVGQQVFIDNVAFRVKGVLEPRGLDVHGRDQDNVLVIPYTTLMDKILRVTWIPAVTLLVEDASRVPAAKAEIERILRERHQISDGQEDDFTVVTTDMVMQMFNHSLGTMKIFVPLIAATSFLISALVILSIMQLSIRARTAEIGLRKALGARERDLRTQLFMEVAAISVIASIAGVGLTGFALRALMPILTKRLGVEHVSVAPALVVIAIVAAIATGLIGVLLPARRAARLDPVQALR